MLELYLTGAASDGGEQTDPIASIGGYRAARRLKTTGVTVAGNGMVGLALEAVSGACLTASSSLGIVQAESANQLRFNGPDGSLGRLVPIEADTSVIVNDGSESGQWVRLRRVGEGDLEGVCNFTVSERTNALFDNQPTELWATGRTDYRCVCIKNTAAIPVADVALWLGPDCDAAIAIGLELPASQPAGAFATPADELTAPSGVTFVTPDSSGHADALTADWLWPGEILGLWIRRTVGAEAAANLRNQLDIRLSYKTVLV